MKHAILFLLASIGIANAQQALNAQKNLSDLPNEPLALQNIGGLSPTGPGSGLTNLPTNPSLYPTLNQSTTGTSSFSTSSGTATHATYYDGVLAGDVTGPTGTTVVGSALHVPSTNFPPFVAQTNMIGSTIAPASGSPNYLQKTNNLTDVLSSPTAAANLGMPTLIGPASATVICSGDSLTQGLYGLQSGAPQNFPAVLQAGPFGAGGALVYSMGASQETTAQIAGHYFNPGLGLTGAVTSGSGTVTLNSNSAAIVPNAGLTGPGIPANAYVSAISGTSTGTTTVTMAVGGSAATGTATSAFENIALNPSFTNTVSFAANSGTATLGSPLGAVVGNGITSVGLQPDTYITSVASGTTVLLSRLTTLAEASVPCSGAAQVQGVYASGPYQGGAANNWTNFHMTPHMLSYAVTGKPTFNFLFCGNNDFPEYVAGAFTATGTLTNGSPVVSIPSGYASIANGDVLTATGLPSGNQALYIVSGGGTNSVTLSANFTGTTGSATITVHVPGITRAYTLASWISDYQAFVANCHADGNTVANGGGVIVSTFVPQGDSSRTGISEVFRGEFNAAILGGTIGQDYTFSCGQYFPSSSALAASGGFPYLNPADNLHFAAPAANLIGQQLGQFLLNITKTTNTGAQAAPGIGSLLGPAHVIYVSQGFGSDQRVGGTPYSFSAPFQTLKAAMGAAQSGDTIVGLDGTFTDAVTWTSGVSVQLYAGASWVPTTSAISDGGVGITGTLSCLGGSLGSFAASNTFASFTGGGTSFTFNNVNATISGSGSGFVTATGTNSAITISGNVTANTTVVTLTGANSSLNMIGNAKSTAGNTINCFTAGPYNVFINGDVTTASTGSNYALGIGGGNYRVTGLVSNASATTNAIYPNSTQTSLIIGALSEPAGLSYSFSSSIPLTIEGQNASVRTVAGTTGSATFNESVISPNKKEVVINLSSLTGTATSSFQRAFTSTPIVVNSDAAVTSLSTTAVTVTGSGTSRTIILEGQ